MIDNVMLILLGVGFAIASLLAALAIVVFIARTIKKRIYRWRAAQNRMKPVSRDGKSLSLENDLPYQVGDLQKWKRQPRHVRLPPKHR